jgi:hypothetical protein
MLRTNSEKGQWRGIAFAAGAAALLLAALLTAGAAGTDNPTSDDNVGTIEGESISLQGPMSVEVVHGQVRTMLRSGNDIRVKSGQARLELVEGGKIAICGPAHLSVLKSGGSLTVALDTGVIRVHIEKQPVVTIYTAQIQAKPISIADGPQDALIGFDAPATMCVRATTGAIRLEQQLTGQNVIVPQGGDILLNNGALDGLVNTGGHCACEMQLAKAEVPRPELSRLATTEEIQKKEAEVKKVPPTTEKPVATEKAALSDKLSPPKQVPVYQVFMPPLAFDAKAAAQREDFDPKLILLVRRVRVRPTLIFQGRVEGDAVVKPVTVAKQEAAKPAPSTKANPPENDSVVNRVRAFWHRLFS